MSNRDFKDVQALETNIVLLGTLLSIDTDASVKSDTDCKFGAWTKTGTGEYTLTLREAFARVWPIVQLGTGAVVGKLKSFSASSKTVVINTVSATNLGTPTDAAAAALIPVELFCKNSQQKL